MYDFLLLAHVIAAFLVLAMVVIYTAFILGQPTSKPAVLVAQIFDNLGGGGTLIFGVWLALYVDGYEVWDGWIIAALVLWAAAAETGRRTHVALEPVFAGGPGDAPPRIDPAAIRWHLIRTAVIVLLLADMIYKPGA